MATFFQKIPTEKFNAASSFVVKESRTMNLIIGLFSLVFVVASFSLSIWVACLFTVPSLIFFVKAARNHTIMVINKTGFYYYGNLLTTWNNFVNVEFLDEIRVPDENSSGVGDNFSLLIKYYKDDKPGCYSCKIPLTNSQDKAEEEIIAAITFYHRHHKSV